MISVDDSDKAAVMESIEIACKDLGVALPNLPVCPELQDGAGLQVEPLKTLTSLEKNDCDYDAVKEGSLQCGQIVSNMEADGDKIVRQLKRTLGSIVEPCAMADSKDGERVNSSMSFSSTVDLNEGRQGRQGHVKVSGLSSVRHRQRQLLSKKAQNQQSNFTKTFRETSQQMPIRVARPPGEGRGRNQLLPRYWPRITEQELQQISFGDSNCTITPLFEKMLSASDAGRIGRLVLPKACAEAYFPPILHPEGLPLKIQDISGKDWVFQFRFWPNNNSRMYVLEGVTPCIQSMHLQAGDIVTFSRLDPQGKLVMGYRRAPNPVHPQVSQGEHDPQPSTIESTSTAASTLTSRGMYNLSSITSLTSLLSNSVRGDVEVQANGIFEQLNISKKGYGWCKTEKAESKEKEGSLVQCLFAADKRRGQQISSKKKRLQMDMEKSVEFKISWKEAQVFLRPPPDVAPSIVIIEGHEFEEYEEPPIFGKRTIFTTGKFGPEDQWAQCDECGTWRKVPADVFLPTRWACADNVWDLKRGSCDAPQEVDNKEIESLLQHMNAPGTMTTLGESNTASSSSPAQTTKHPRHRPGCTCIVCIQPPSGKGPKHKPTCDCNVCMTVKRRFKTLMMRRKKRQSEQEAEKTDQKKKRTCMKEEREVNSGRKLKNDRFSLSKNDYQKDNLSMSVPGVCPQINSFHSNGDGFSLVSGTLTDFHISTDRISRHESLATEGQIDLNSQPERQEEASRGVGNVSMVRLLDNASYPLEEYLKQMGLTSLICPQQTLVSSMSFPKNLFNQNVDEHNGNQSMLIMPSDITPDESYMTVGIAQVGTPMASSQEW